MSNLNNINSHRHHKVTNSYGVYDGYKYYRKNKPKDKAFILTESQYFSIIRTVNKLLGEELSEGNNITLPDRMGRLELRKYQTKIYFDGNKVKTNFPINWCETLKLWDQDEEARKNKTLIKREEKEIYRIYYNKTVANYNNKAFYQFKVNREVKINLKNNIKEGDVDAFTF